MAVAVDFDELLDVVVGANLGASAGKDIQTSKRLVSPGQGDERRHGQTDFVFASRPATAGRLAFVSAAAMTARGLRAFGRGKLNAVDFPKPFGGTPAD